MRERSDQSAREQKAFYEHSTDLSNKTGPIFSIKSLKKPELQLRLPTQDDSEALLRVFTDPRNVQYDKSCNGLDTREAITNLITQWSSLCNPFERANIVVTVHGQVVGTGGLGWIGKRKSDGLMIGDAGMMIDPNFRGKGYAYEELCMVVDHGFCVLGMDEIYIACVDANSAFKGLMNVKFGFEALPTEDKFGNEWVWEIKKREWRGSRNSRQGRDEDL
jgi:RimJ/RimL family protein N-acetyltransferase